MEASDWNEASELQHLTHWLPLPSPPDNAAELNDLDVSVSPQQAAPKAAPGEPIGWAADRVRIEKTEKNGWCAYLDVQDAEGNHIGTVNLCRGISSENAARDLVQNWMREFVPNPKQVAAPQQEAQEPSVEE